LSIAYSIPSTNKLESEDLILVTQTRYQGFSKEVSCGGFFQSIANPSGSEAFLTYFFELKKED